MSKRELALSTKATNIPEPPKADRTEPVSELAQRLDERQIREWREYFGSRLLGSAQRLGLKGADVARRAGINPKAYNNYVKGRRLPALYELPIIAAALDMSIDELLDLKPMLSARDERTYAGMHRFHAAAGSLRPDDIHFLADVAETISSRRDRERRKLRAAQDRVILAFEALLPAVMEEYQPTTVETHTQHSTDGNEWLRIGLAFPVGSDLNALRTDLTNLAMEKIYLERADVDVRGARPGQSDVSVAIWLLLGPSPPDKAPSARPSSAG